MIKVLTAYISTLEMLTFWYLYGIMIIASYIFSIVGSLRGRGNKNIGEIY